MNTGKIYDNPSDASAGTNSLYKLAGKNLVSESLRRVPKVIS